MNRRVMYAAVLLTLGAGVGLAEVAHGAPIPGTTEFLQRTTPMISGTVASADARQIVVDTDQGDRVTLLMDSRTMLPTDLAPGMVMRAEFRVLENGQYYVTRMTPDRDGMSSQDATATVLLQSNDEDLASAGVAPVNAAPAVSEGGATGQTVQAEPAGTGEPAADQAAATEAPVTEIRPDSLPGTGGLQPLVALLGLLALGGAGLLMLMRRRDRA